MTLNVSFFESLKGVLSMVDKITDKFRIGASYYPEWWPEEQWEEDFSKMEKLGFNVVRMGEFAWSWYEPEEGKFNFEPMRRAVDCAERHGIQVVMGTTTAVCPAWLYRKHPEVKGGNEKGHYDFGGRKGQCLSSEVFLKYARRITEEQTKALGNHPNIIGWQLDNEPGFPFRDYDPCCNQGFRDWLREKYKTIDELNRAWNNMTWSNRFTDFNEIDIPVNSSEGGWTLQNQLDYRKYFSFTFHRLLKMEAELVRKYSPDRFIYTNWPGANWSVNCFEGMEYLDYAAWDNYVPQPNGDDYRVQLRAGMEHSFDRRLGNGKQAFLVAEQQARVDANTDPAVMRAQTWFNVANGAFATIFFEWRCPVGGAEQSYPGLLALDEQVPEDIASVIKRLTGELSKHYEKINGAVTKSKIAVVYSYESSWGRRDWTVDGFYDEEIFNAYSGFKNALQTNVDVIGIDDDLSDYGVIVLPNHSIMTEKQATALEEFARNGGIVVTNTASGIHDEYNRTRQLLQPGLLATMCGAKVVGEISASKLEKQTGLASEVEFPDGTRRKISHTVHKLRSDTADTVAVYTTGRLKGTPAVTLNAFGDGYAVLCATDGNDVFYYETLASWLKERFEIKPLLDVDDGIITSSRIKDGVEYIIAVNMKDAVCKVRLTEPMEDILNGKTVSGEVGLPPYEILFVRKK